MKPARLRSKGLFGALLLMMMLMPLEDPASWTGVLFRISVLTTLLMALRSVSDDRLQLRIGALLVVVPVALNVLVMISGDTRCIPFSLVCIILFCGQLTYIKIRKTLESPQVTGETIYSAVTAYMVAGLAWSCLYMLLEMLQPGSFQGQLHPHRFFPNTSPADMLYFSIATMTTAGYGDIFPVLPLSRSFACLQMLFGTMYPTIILARLVGLHAAQRS